MIKYFEAFAGIGAFRSAFEENGGLQQMLTSVAVQTCGELKNISQSLGFVVKQPNGKLKFQPIAEYYQSTLDNAIMGIASGAFDYNTVIKRTISEMTNSGLRTVDYSSGWSNRVDVAARRSIMTGLSQLTAKVNEDNAKALDTDMFEVSWHSGARPSHQVWQGKWFTHQQLEEVCGLGRVDGLCGANCYHDYYPVIPGISQPTYTPEQLAEMNAAENTPTEYNGKEYTKYEALQRQRRLETTMRAQRQQIKLLEDAGADEDDIINARCRYHGTSQDYTAFSKAMDLPQQRARVTADGLGNIGVGKYKNTLTNAAGKPIIKVKKTSITGKPSSITQKENAKGGIDRNYYDENGRQNKQVSNHNHGNPKKHPYGEKGEHAHDYYYDDDGNLTRGRARELNDEEQKENGDIL